MVNKIPESKLGMVKYLPSDKAGDNSKETKGMPILSIHDSNFPGVVSEKIIGLCLNREHQILPISCMTEREHRTPS